MTAYLLYTLYEADFELRRQGSFYGDLSVPLAATDREIKSRFRRLAALYHPDKAAQSGADPAQANAHFVHLKTAADTLLDPARRFAYDRFGPDVVAWQHCTTVRDFVARGAQVLIPYYGVAAVALYAFGLLGYLDWGRYERWLVLALVLLFELYAVTRPAPPWLLARVVNPLIERFGAPGRAPYLPFQAVSLARRASMTLYIAFSQIGPLLAADTREGRLEVRKAADDDAAALREGLDHLEKTVDALGTDADRLLAMEMSPFAADEAALASVRAKMRHWLVQNTIHMDPMVRDAMGREIRKRRTDAPPGARGTR